MADNDKKIPIETVKGGGIGDDLLESYFKFKDGKYKYFDKDNSEKSPSGGIAAGGSFSFQLDEVTGIQWTLTIDPSSTANLVTGEWSEVPIPPPPGWSGGLTADPDQTFTAQSSGIEEDSDSAASATA